MSTTPFQTTFLPSPLLSSPKTPPSHPKPHITCSTPDPDPKKPPTPLLIAIPATLTILSTTLPASARVRSKKPSEALSPEALRAWCDNLPTVSDRIPYSHLPDLARRGALKHIVKLPSSDPKLTADAVLVVLDDSRVLRSTLPSADGDARFWNAWDDLGLGSKCVNAYTPPLKPPELPRSYLWFVTRFPVWMFSLLLRKPPKKKKGRKKELEGERRRNEILERRQMELARVEEEKQRAERAARTKQRVEERSRRIAVKKLKRVQYFESLKQARQNYRDMANFWGDLAGDQNFITLVGVLFFFLFYRVVVLSYRKQKRDYEDRLKIEEAEKEEKKRMKQLEREMSGLEGPGDDAEGDREQNPYMKMAMQFMQSGARVRRAQGKKLPQYMERGNDVKFSDVAGLGKIRLELEEIVKFFTHGEIYRRRGVKIPGGILLCGPPGVGKTLLAKAVAGEAGVNFFSISASQFVEIYVGVGASRVRALYQEARENAPSVVFIDELDAVGRERGLIKGSGGQERDATLNQLLVCLDGFEGRGDVITIAATNRPDILDPALVRPGRFDRKIFIPKPGVIGRIEILKVHARKKPMVGDIDYEAVASMTDGMVGAELANIIEVAAINMLREGRAEITTDDLLQAAQIEERGMLDKKERSLDMWKRLALNEAAMAVAAVNFPELRNIEFITISPRAGRELGYVRVKMDHMKFMEGMLSRKSLLDHITVQVAPRAADEIWHGEDQLSTIWAETTNNARSAARCFVLGGLSEKYYGRSDFWVADRINDIDQEALKILNTCYNNAKEILKRNQILIDAVVDRLIQKKSVAKSEFFQLVEEHGQLEPSSPSILDIRINKRAQFQEMLAASRKATHDNSL